MLVRVRPLTRSVVVALLLAIVPQQAALAATRDVLIQGFAFEPATVRGNVGDTVQWWNNETVEHHTSTSTLGLWGSDDLEPGASFAHVFTAAGTFSYLCTIHPFMTGSVAMRMKARPRTGTTTTEFRITWGARPGIPSGYNADVEIQPPGTTGFVTWAENRTGTAISKAFLPDAGAGTYRFRTRLQRDATGQTSGWSPTLSVRVS